MFCIKCGKEIEIGSNYCISCGTDQNMAEQESDKPTYRTNVLSKTAPRIEVFFKYVLLFAIAIGIWALVLQNSGFIPTSKNVYVEGGNIEASVEGDVAIINSVDVSGSNVRVSNEVDVNLASINDNGKSSFYGRSNRPYDAIHVYTGD